MVIIIEKFEKFGKLNMKEGELSGGLKESYYRDSELGVRY